MVIIRAMAMGHALIHWAPIRVHVMTALLEMGRTVKVGILLYAF